MMRLTGQVGEVGSVRGIPHLVAKAQAALLGTREGNRDVLAACLWRVAPRTALLGTHPPSVYLQKPIDSVAPRRSHSDDGDSTHHDRSPPGLSPFCPRSAPSSSAPTIETHWKRSAAPQRTHPHNISCSDIAVVSLHRHQ
jgi:hypothetical protein